MIKEEKALYQVKLILDYLPEEEYKLIPQDELDYIEDNFEYDENIVIDPSIPLQNQRIDEKTYQILDRIMKKIEVNRNKINNKEISQYVSDVKESNADYDAKIENVRLKNIIEVLKKENSKLSKAKNLLSEYKNALSQTNRKITELKKKNEALYEYIQGLPEFIKRIFIKDDISKLLKI